MLKVTVAIVPSSADLQPPIILLVLEAADGGVKVLFVPNVSIATIHSVVIVWLEPAILIIDGRELDPEQDAQAGTPTETVKH